MNTDVDPGLERVLAERLDRLAAHARIDDFDTPRPLVARVDSPKRRPALIGVAALAVLVAAATALVMARRDSTTTLHVGNEPGDIVEVLPAAPLQGRNGHAALWTGSEFIVWGGAGEGGVAFADGAAYNPRSREWRVLAAAPISARGHPAYVWTGQELFVWGGFDRGKFQRGGAAYDPTRDTWRAVADDDIGAKAAAVWTGTDVIVVGGFVDGGFLTNTARAYDPVTDRWRPIATPPGDPLAPRPQIVWSSTEGAAFMLLGEINGTKTLASYDPRADAWTNRGAAPIPANSAPEIQIVDDELLVLSSSKNGPMVAMDLPTNKWSTLTTWSGEFLGPMVATDNTAVFWNGGSVGALYDVRTHIWRSFDAGGLASREDHRLVVAGADVITWGGFRSGRSSAADGVIIHVTNSPGPTEIQFADATCIVFMDPEASADQIDIVGHSLRQRTEVTNLRLMSQAAAYDEFVALFKDKPDLVSSVAPGILPTSWRFELDPDTPETRTAVSDDASTHAGVKTTHCQP